MKTEVAIQIDHLVGNAPERRPHTPEVDISVRRQRMEPVEATTEQHEHESRISRPGCHADARRGEGRGKHAERRQGRVSKEGSAIEHRHLLWKLALASTSARAASADGALRTSVRCTSPATGPTRSSSRATGSPATVCVAA